jgi:hypothetical protein
VESASGVIQTRQVGYHQAALTTAATISIQIKG